MQALTWQGHFHVRELRVKTSLRLKGLPSATGAVISYFIVSSFVSSVDVYHLLAAEILTQWQKRAPPGHIGTLLVQWNFPVTADAYVACKFHITFNSIMSVQPEMLMYKVLHVTPCHYTWGQSFLWPAFCDMSMPLNGINIHLFP